MLTDAVATARKCNLLATVIEMVWSLNARLSSGALRTLATSQVKQIHDAQITGITKPLRAESTRSRGLSVPDS
jgi:hypothetical protein